MAAPEPDSPPFRHLFGSSLERGAFLKHYLADPLSGGLQWFGFHALSLLSPSGASAAGARLATGSRILNRKQPWLAQMRGTVARLRPDIQSEADLDEFVAAWFRNMGRNQAEYPIMHKIKVPGNVDLTWDAKSADLIAEGRPLVFVNCHLGSFDVTVMAVGVQFDAAKFTFGPFETMDNRFQNRLAARVRKQLGFPVIPPGPLYRRYLPKLMRDGKQSILLHIDDHVADTVNFPLFGREPSSPSNLFRALKTARLFDAPIVPLLGYRTGSCQAKIHIHAPLMPEDIGASRHDMQAGVEYLNNIYEPVVRQHLDQWFMLPWLDLEK